MRRIVRLAADWLGMGHWLFPAALLPAFLAVAVGLQVLGGAYRCEFGGHPDEAGHYVTGLLMRDFLARARPGNPMAYAKTYYQHYPKVALGNWPPGFYLAQAGWTLPLGAGRVQILSLMAAIGALVAALVAGVAARRVPRPLAGACGLAFLLLPLVQEYVGMVMTEPSIALLALLATAFWARYLVTERVRDALGFGLVAGCCIMTKGTGFLLAGVPVLSVLLTRRWELFRRVSFWVAAVVVAVVAGPWTALTLKLAKEGWEHGVPSLGFTLSAIPYYAGKWHHALGSPLSLLALLGLVAACGAAWRKGRDGGLEASVAALVLSVFLLHVLVPCGHEARHLVPALAGSLVLASFGAHEIWRRLGATRLGRGGEAAVLAASVVLLFAVQTFAIPAKGYRGFRAVAERILGTPEDAGTVLLVSSDARGEGMFIAEVAMGEKRPGHVVQRTSKLLAESGWSGGDYQAKAGDAAQLVEILAKAGVGLVVVDTTVPPQRRAKMPHHALLEQVAAAETALFVPEGTYPLLRANERFEHGIRVYRFRNPTEVTK